MNERLLELMKQADYPAPEIAKRAQKLAELIIRECADVAYHYDGLTIGQGYTVAKHIRKHFEVKE